MKIGIEEIRDIAVGAAILGCGGGGDPEIGRLMAEDAIRQRGRVTLTPPDEVADDAQILASAMMGAPTVVVEKVPSGLEPTRAFRRLEQAIGRPADYVCSMECGGLNSTIPILVAAQTGLPLIDGDGMGRAFPELQMETFSVYGVRGSPACVVDEDGNAVLCETTSDYDMEWLLRGVTIRMGGAAYLAHYPMTGADFKRTAIWGTISLARALGYRVSAARRLKRDPIEAVADAFQGTVYGGVRELFRGKVIDVSRETRRGFALGQVRLGALSFPLERELVIAFQNENLVAWADGEVQATVPDLIICLDPETAQAVPTERLHYGQRLVALTVEAPAIMCRPEALRVWGPEAFGFEGLRYQRPGRQGEGLS